MNFNYLLPGGGKGSRIFGEDHMVFRGTRGGQSSLTEYEGGETGKFFDSKKFPSIIKHHAKFCGFLHILSLQNFCKNTFYPCKTRFTFALTHCIR